MCVRVCMYVCLALSVSCPLANRGTCDLLLLPSLPSYLSLCMSPCLSVSLCIFLDCLPGPIVASLASMAQASTLKKCKASDQSGLERQCTQRPQCETLFFSLFFILPHSPLLAQLSGSQQAVVEDSGMCDHTLRRAEQHAHALELSGSATSSVLISSCTQQYDVCIQGCTD